MRVLQLIDSLQVGGAEQIAINYANSLIPEIDTSYLCATRMEGKLKDKIDNKVGYLFLNKRSTLDIGAIRRLERFVKKNRIDVIHAHTTSFFLATLVKLMNRRVRLIWHDHNGNRVTTGAKRNRILKYCSYFFTCVIVVNKNLKSWAETHLKVKQVYYVPNFSMLEEEEINTILKGNEGKRVVCLANLRHPKNHMLLLKAFFKISKLYSDWSLHLIGEDYNDAYSARMHQFIKDNGLDKSVYLYGLRRDIKGILAQGNIGVLCSSSEGLPLTLLEYGESKLAVVATNVGNCKKVITNSNEGFLIPNNNEHALIEALAAYIKSPELRLKNGAMLQQRVVNDFNRAEIIKDLVSIYIHGDYA